MDKEVLRKKLERLNFKQKILIFSLSILIIFMGYWYFFFRSQHKELNGLEKDIASLNKNIARLRPQVKQLPEIKKKLQDQKNLYIYAKKLLPKSNNEVESLLSEIEKLGKDVGVEFLLFAPGREKSDKFYATRFVNLRLKGPFHNLMLFFSKMSRLNRLVTLEDLRLNRTNQNENKIMLSADCRIAIYKKMSPKTDPDQK